MEELRTHQGARHRTRLISLWLGFGILVRGCAASRAIDTGLNPLGTWQSQKIE